MSLPGRARLVREVFKYRQVVVLGLATLLGVAALISGFGVGLDRFLREQRDAIRARPASGEVQIVEIDARSLDAIDRWPWRRRVHAAAIDRLREAGARSIAFDVDFSASSNPADDRLMAASLKRAGGSVILPTFRQRAESGRARFVDRAPIEMFADNASLAAVNIGADGDGHVRLMPTGLETMGVPRPSLAALLAERTVLADEAFEIDFAIEPATIPRHSIIDLLSGRVPADELAGKRIIIGATAIEMGDRYPVPRHGVVPGVVLQAVAAETLLAGPVPRRGSPWPGLIMAVALAGLVLRARSARKRFAVSLAGGLALLGLPLLTEYMLAISLPLAPAITVLASAGLIGGALLLAWRHSRRQRINELSGLPNRLALVETTAGADQAQIVVARIVGFAEIASALGHADVARLLAALAERLRSRTGEAVIYHADELSLAWAHRSDDASLAKRLEGIAEMMREPIACGDRFVDVTLSFGSATGLGSEAQQLVSNASLAALRASQRGVRWLAFTQTELDETSWRLSLLSELDAAMRTGQIWQAYQPKLDLRSGTVTGAEALVRWDHHQRGLIPPDRFVPVVEEHGRARDLTTYVLEQALRDCERWAGAGYVLEVAVNVSATLLTDHEFIEKVALLLQGSAVPTHRVTVEVTESAAMQSPEHAVPALESWRSLGLNISIDDYGTGHSSLNYLQALPATELKIDKRFVQTVATEPRNAIMVRSTIELAHQLGMKVVAEGVENEETLRLLTEMGCDIAQGFHIARPMPSSRLLQFLDDRSRTAA